MCHTCLLPLRIAASKVTEEEEAGESVEEPQGFVKELVEDQGIGFIPPLQPTEIEDDFMLYTFLTNGNN